MTGARGVSHAWLAANGIVLFSLYPLTAAYAQTDWCRALTESQKALVHDAFLSLHPYDGCDATFDQCLARQPVPPVVLRLANDICRQIAAGKHRKDIEHALARRAQSMLPIGKPAAITIDEATLAGDSSAPVAVVVYACARCPFCKLIVPTLHQQVTEGPLRGKARLYFRPFPLKDHAGSNEGGLALLTAAKLGRFWPLLLKTYQSFDSFSPLLLPEWAESVGMNRADFQRAYTDPQLRDALVAAKQEGIRNTVDRTPTLFINGRKYVYEAQPDIILDVLAEAYESATWHAPRDQ